MVGSQQLVEVIEGWLALLPRLDGEGMSASQQNIDWFKGRLGLTREDSCSVERFLFRIFEGCPNSVCAHILVETRVETHQ